jgi:hypothetical protein
MPMARPLNASVSIMGPTFDVNNRGNNTSLHQVKFNMTRKTNQHTYLLLHCRGVLMRRMNVQVTKRHDHHPRRRQMWYPDNNKQNAYTTICVRPRTIRLRYNVIINQPNARWVRCANQWPRIGTTNTIYPPLGKKYLIEDVFSSHVRQCCRPFHGLR